MIFDGCAVVFGLASVLTAASPHWASAQQAAPARRIVRSQDDLPRHVYRLPGTAEDLLATDDQTFNAFAARVAADADAVLNGYDIADHATRRRLLTTRASYEMLTGRDKQALMTILAIRALEDKPDAKLTSGLREEAILRARIATGEREGPAFDEQFATRYRQSLAALPFAVVGTRLREIKNKIDFQTPAVISGYIANQVEPIVAREHAVTDTAADELLWARTYRRVMAPTREASAAVLESVIAAGAVTKTDIWASRDVALSAQDTAQPVAVAVWDSGIDTSLFPGLLFAAIEASPGNPHGLSFDIDSRPSSGVLRPMTAAQRAEYGGMIADAQGFSDNEAGIDSPAAATYRAKFASMTATESAAYLERLPAFGDYGHGTHVAGIVARGNPFIRLAIIRDTYDARAVPAPPTEASVARRAELYDRVSDWLKTNRIRVVNMSWGETPGDYESALEKNGLGGSAINRRAVAHRLFTTARDAFRRLLAANPDTLFVSTAGNANTDTAFDQGYPSGLVAPNLMIVSAVDQAGDETSFTSNGPTVTVSANGYQVESYFPGGTRLRRSGTSSAAPNVANLAAKLIALRPSLTSAEVIDLINRGATTSADGRRRNIDPRASIALLRASAE